MYVHVRSRDVAVTSSTLYDYRFLGTRLSAIVDALTIDLTSIDSFRPDIFPRFALFLCPAPARRTGEIPDNANNDKREKERAEQRRKDLTIQGERSSETRKEKGRYRHDISVAVERDKT